MQSWRRGYRRGSTGGGVGRKNVTPTPDSVLTQAGVLLYPESSGKTVTPLEKGPRGTKGF